MSFSTDYHHCTLCVTSKILHRVAHSILSLLSMCSRLNIFAESVLSLSIEKNSFMETFWSFSFTLKISLYLSYIFHDHFLTLLRLPPHLIMCSCDERNKNLIGRQVVNPNLMTILFITCNYIPIETSTISTLLNL